MRRKYLDYIILVGIFTAIAIYALLLSGCTPDNYVSPSRFGTYEQQQLWYTQQLYELERRK